MKFRFLSACILTSLCVVSTAGFARNPANVTPPAKASYKTDAADCNIPVSEFDMDINNVRARLLDAGDMWWDLSTAHYEVPKGSRTSGTQFPQAIFAGAIWISGLDQGNNLKIAAQEYRTGTTDFWTGPLDNSAAVSQGTCNLWDQHFNVLGTEIKDLITLWNNSNLSPGNGHLLPITDTVQIAPNVLHWPAKGNPNSYVSNLNLTGGNFAPFFDNDGDGIYNPLAGDYPSIYNNTYGCTTCGCNGNTSHDPILSSPYADQMVFWVMNDKGGVHTTTNGLPMGVQINTLAFAFISSDEVNNMTFYRYNVINRSGSAFSQTYMTQFMDPDLGCSENDRIGCDVSRSLGVVYNGNLGTGSGVTPDAGIACLTGAVGYGANLPMLGCDFFEGPIDTGGRKLGMSSFQYFSRTGGTDVTDPLSAVQFRNYQTGKWRTGVPVTFGGNGLGGTTPTSYVFPGDPSVSTQWSECNPQSATPIPSGDRRFVQTSGPFYFLPGATENITIGVIFVQPAGGVGSNCPSFSSISTADDKAQALFDNCFAQLQGPSAPLLDIRELSNKIIINVKDDPKGNNVGENYAQLDINRLSKGYVVGSLKDSLYKYQGYIIYQLSDPNVTATDLTDPTKAIPVAVYDINDGIKHLVNWTQGYDPLTGAYSWVPSANTVPGVGNDLPNIGIRHSLIDSMDLVGGGQMVNHMTYYFGVISFATNNFKIFKPDSIASGGQTQPFLLGKNFNKYSAIPSDISPENGGRQLNSTWGQATAVKRIEGQGNGGNYIDITPATIAKILDNPLNYTDTLDYTVGNDPIGFKVTDPILLKDADFELKIIDTIPYNGVSVSTLARWTLTDLTNNKIIQSARTLDIPYEQNIADDLGNEYGFSITLGTPFPVYTNILDGQPIYGAIGGSITFQDSSKPWLSFVADNGSNDVTNWVRSGTNFVTCQVPTGQMADILCNTFSDAYNKVGGINHFSDPDHVFDKMIGGKWAPYCLAANWSMSPIGGNLVVTSGRPQTVGGPAFKWDKYNDQASPPRNNLDRLQSVDIVLTSDKSKWSKCAVFETGENPQGADLDPNGQGKAPRKGMLRGHYSMDINGNYSNDPSLTGISYFPGYAVNIETGQRLEMAFGEASDERDQNGQDMIWNPTSQVLGTLNGGGAIPFTPIFAGKHFIYVLDYAYPDRTGGNDNGGDSIHKVLTDPGVYQSMVTNPTSQTYTPDVIGVYDHIMWTAIPYVTPGYSMKSFADGLIPNDVTIKLRVQKPYAKFGTAATATYASPDSFPRYTFSTHGLAMVEQKDSVAKTALDIIRIVPNPYYAYSAYEQSANDARVKITNLPNVCSIKIFTLDGTLVRVLNRSISGNDPATNKKIEISDGYDLNDKTGSANLDNSVDWDLKNEKNIPVASGIYLFDINVPGVGHKTLKWFGAMRPTDISNF